MTATQKRLYRIGFGLGARGGVAPAPCFARTAALRRAYIEGWLRGRDARTTAAAA